MTNIYSSSYFNGVYTYYFLNIDGTGYFDR